MKALGVRTLTWITVLVATTAIALAILILLITKSTGAAFAVLVVALLTAAVLGLVQLQGSAGRAAPPKLVNPEPTTDSAASLPISDVTGLYLLWVFRQRLEEEVARDRHYGHSFALLLLEPADLLKLPTVADYTEAGRELRHCLRPGDFAAQFDSERFIVLMPETDGDRASTVGKRIILRLREGTPSRASWTGSVVRYPEDGENGEDLLHQASELLKQGRIERLERAEQAERDAA